MIEMWLWMLTVITLLYDRFIKQLSICSFIHTPDVHQLFIFCDQPWCRLFKNEWFLSCLIILCERLFNKCCVIWVMFMQQKTWLMRKFFLSLVSRLYRRWFWNIYVHHCDWSSRAGTLCWCLANMIMLFSKVLVLEWITQLLMLAS